MTVDIVMTTGNEGFEFVTPGAKITEILESIKDRMVRIANAYGISSDNFKLTGNIASGFAMQMQNLELMEAREDDLAFMAAGEKDLFEKTRLVWNTHVSEAERIPEETMLKIDFHGIEFPLTVQEKIMRRQNDLDLGLKTLVDIYVESNPGTSKDDAKKIVAENMAMNREMMGMATQKQTVLDKVAQQTQQNIDALNNG
jgi:hypothetical protein